MQREHLDARLTEQIRLVARAVGVVVRKPGAFRGCVLDAAGELEDLVRRSWTNADSRVIEDLGPPPDVGDALRTSIRAAAESHPHFLSQQKKGRRVAWIVPSPSVNPPEEGVDPAVLEELVSRVGEHRQQHVERLQRLFPPPWQVYPEYTADTCANWRSATEASLKGYSAQWAAYGSCLLGEPDSGPSPVVTSEDGRRLVDVRGLFDSLQPRKQHPCPAVDAGKGRHGYRVVPLYKLWQRQDVARREPPQNAEVVILDAWPERERRWAPKRLREVAQSHMFSSVARLLEELATMAQDGEGLSGAALYERLGVLEVEAMLSASQGDRHRWSRIAYSRSRLREAPSNPVPLIEAVADDLREWQASSSSGDPRFFRSRVHVVKEPAGGRVVTRDPHGRVPEVFTRAAIIDLTERARGEVNLLRRQQIEVLSPAQVLERAAPKPSTRELKRGAKLTRLLEACDVLDKRGTLMTKRTIAQHAGITPSDLSRGTLAQDLAREYGGEWVPAQGKSEVLVR